MTIKITPNDKGNPPGKLAEAELHFTEGPLEGLKLIASGLDFSAMLHQPEVPAGASRRRTRGWARSRRAASLPVASQTSAQSRHMRMHWLMSMSSAAQASAQLPRHPLAHRQHVRFRRARDCS